MRYRVIFSLLAMTVLAACATTAPKEPTRAMVEAEQAVVEASSSQAVREQAPVALAKAQDYLKEAEAAHQAGALERANHLAYMAQQQAQIATVIAERQQALARAEELTKTREALLLQARERELQKREKLIEELKQELSELNPQQTEEGVMLTIGDVLFAFDSAALTAAADDPLDRLATFLLDHPAYRVRVEGYTDNIGSVAYNQRLSERRAQSVADAMMARGISPGRMTVVGYGEADPVAPNSTEAGRARNRRVEFVILNAGSAAPA